MDNVEKIETKKKPKSKKKKIVVLSVIFGILAVLITTIVLLYNKYVYCSLQFMSIQKNSNSVVFEIEVVNHTTSSIIFRSDTFSIYSDGAPISASGIKKMNTSFEKETAIDAGDTVILLIEFDEKYDNVDKPLKLYYKGKEILFDKAVRIKSYERGEIRVYYTDVAYGEQV